MNSNFADPALGMTRYLVAFSSLVLLSACTGARVSHNEGRAMKASLVALRSFDVTGMRAREPMVVRGRDGALFVTGYGEAAPVLWRSVDQGATWKSVNVGTAADGAIGNSDVDLAVAPDGTLYFVAMSYDREKNEGTGISVASSRDEGATWKWKSLSRDRFDDRPWVEVSPNGTAHVIWNDGAGQSHAVSTDRGATWSERGRIHRRGGSSHLAISSKGHIAVRITPLSASANKFDKGVDFVAVSSDGGIKWTLRDLPGTRDWSGDWSNGDETLSRWVEPIAWDSQGVLYSLWSEGTSMWLARSADLGVAWTKWRVAQDSVPVYFPYLIARGNGDLAATWYSGLDEAVRVNVAHISYSEGSRRPLITQTVPFAIPSFVRNDSLPATHRDTAGEYVPIMFLAENRLAVVTTIQDRTSQRYGFTFRPFSINSR